MNYEPKCINFHTRKLIWRGRLQNGGHFVSVCSHVGVNTKWPPFCRRSAVIPDEISPNILNHVVWSVKMNSKSLIAKKFRKLVFVSVASIVPVNGLAPWSARKFAVTLMTKFLGSRIYRRRKLLHRCSHSSTVNTLRIGDAYLRQ